MLVFLYSNYYEEAADISNQHPLEFNARMYGLADKYRIEDLKDFAKWAFSLWLPSTSYGKAQFKTSIFVKALRVIYTTTLNSDRPLCDLVFPVIKDYSIDLRDDSGFVEMLSSGFGDGEFARDVFDALLKELAHPKTYQCIDCDMDTSNERIYEGECLKCGKQAQFIVAPKLKP